MGGAAAAVVTVVAAAALTGCAGGVRTAPVPDSDAVLVVESDDGPVVYAADTGTGTGGPTAWLDTGGEPTIASTVVGSTQDGRTVLAWNTAGGSTQFTTVTADGTDPTNVGVGVDTGLAALAGDRLATMRPVTGVGAQLDVRDIDQPDGDVVTVDLGVVPQTVDGDDRQGFLAAAWADDGTLTFQVVGADGVAGDTRTLDLPGRVVVAQWDEDGIVVAVAPAKNEAGQPMLDELRDALPDELPDDLRIVVVGPGSAFLAVGDGIIAYDDVDGGMPVLRAVRDDGTVLTANLPDDEPVQGLRLAATGEIVVLQTTRVVMWEPGAGEPIVLDLPGATTTVW